MRNTWEDWEIKLSGLVGKIYFAFCRMWLESKITFAQMFYLLIKTQH